MELARAAVTVLLFIASLVAYKSWLRESDPLERVILGSGSQVLSGESPNQGLAALLFPRLYPCDSEYPTTEPPNTTLASQSAEDWFLWSSHFSRRIKPGYRGTFVEIGAVDGMWLSNTLFYEKYLGWTGLLFDAYPPNNLEYARNNISSTERRGSVYFPVSICTPPGSTTAEKHWNGALGSIDFISNSSGPNVATSTSPGFSAKGFLQRFGLEGRPTVPVACAPMQPILDVTGMLDIDFFNLDVEGAEFEVVRTIDFRRTNIDLLMVELDGYNPEKDEAVRRLLKEAGFVRIFEDWRKKCPGAKRCFVKNEFYTNPKFESVKEGRIVSKKYHFVRNTAILCSESLEL